MGEILPLCFAVEHSLIPSYSFWSLIAHSVFLTSNKEQQEGNALYEQRINSVIRDADTRPPAQSFSLLPLQPSVPSHCRNTNGCISQLPSPHSPGSPKAQSPHCSQAQHRSCQALGTRLCGLPAAEGFESSVARLPFGMSLLH